MKITIKTLGGSFEFDSEDCSTYTDALEAFERIHGKSMKGMDLFENGKKITDLNKVLEGDNTELVAVKSKHESA